MKLISVKATYLIELVVVVPTLLFFKPSQPFMQLFELLPLWQKIFAICIILAGLIFIPPMVNAFVVLFLKLPAEKMAAADVRRLTGRDISTPNLEDYVNQLLDDVEDFFGW